MFEHSIIDARGPDRGWSFALSMGVQIAAIGVILLIPLVFTYEIPLDNWAASRFFLAPPAPPPPPAPPQVTPVARIVPDRFVDILKQPVAIPDKVALIDDKGATPSYLAGAAASSGVLGGLPGGVPDGIVGSSFSDSMAPPPPMPIRVGGRVQSARLIHRVSPAYPADALEEGISGTVELEAIVSFDGRIRDLKLTSGHPLLAPAAIEAVKQWRYSPTRLNGNIVEVISSVEVIFKIQLLDKKEFKRQKREARRKAAR